MYSFGELFGIAWIHPSDRPTIYHFVLAVVRFITWFPWLHIILETKSSVINSHFYTLTLLNSLFVVSSTYTAYKIVCRMKKKARHVS